MKVKKDRRPISNTFISKVFSGILNGMENRKRLVSGIQPTGKMHVGNYLGAVQNWVRLQHEFDSFFMIVDWHSLTTLYANTGSIREDKHELAMDLLSSGIEPDACCLFYQSDVPEHTELHLILSMLTPISWLTRVPSYKDKIRECADRDLDTYGFLGYPVLMASDILLYKGEIVPVGKDQLPHLEFTREIARRFHYFYNRQIFPLPEEKLTQYPVLPGTDGRKMSKSYNNTIPVSASPEEMTKRVMGMFTDPARKKRTDPGNPDICPVYAYHKIFNTPERQETIHSECSNARIGCVECKREFARNLTRSFEGFHERRKTYSESPKRMEDILKAGAEKARKIARETIEEVKETLRL